MKKAVLLLICVTLTACKSPFERTRDASNGGATGTLGSSPTFVIFNNELQTGGGAFEYPGGEAQSLAFNDMSNPISVRSIRYSWTGQPPLAGSSNATFAGFDLMHTVDRDSYASTAGRDLRGAGYTKVTFYARGSLSSNTVVKVEVADDGSQATLAPCLTLSSGTANACTAGPLSMPPMTLTSSWQKFTINVDSASLAVMKDFFKSTFVFTPVVGAPIGQGGTVYYDKIQYEQ